MTGKGFVEQGVDKEVHHPVRGIPQQVGLLGGLMKVSPENTAGEALRALFRGWPTVVVPGGFNKLAGAGASMIPRKLAGVGAFVMLGGLHDED